MYEDVGVFKRIYLVCWNDFQAGPSNWFRPMYVDRMTLLVIGLLVNFGLAVYGLVEQPADFASHVLAIFITNQMLYTFFYIIVSHRLLFFCLALCFSTRGSGVMPAAVNIGGRSTIQKDRYEDNLLLVHSWN